AAATIVALSSDGKRALSAGHEKDTVIRLWNAETGKQLLQLKGHTSPVRTVAFSPDGKTVASGARESTIRLWDVGTGKELRQFDVKSKEIAHVEFSQAGSTL